MNNKVYIPILIILVSIYILIHMYIKNSKIMSNESRHLYDNNNYAHYSKITTKNILFYPKYIFSHPQKYTLYAGDALIIPKKWWHWVKSYENTFSVNYWYDKDIKNIFEYPDKKENFIKKIDILNNERVKRYLFNFNILEGNENNIKNIDMTTFLKEKKENIYLITLDAFIYNDFIKSYLKDIIEHPKIIVDNKINNYNFWYSPKKMDTGLHYDDNNGILCVLSGKKTVYLYPPSDIKYLYPYDLKPIWYYNKFEDMEYNIYKLNSTNLLDKIPSNRNLYIMLKNKRKIH